LNGPSPEAVAAISERNNKDFMLDWIQRYIIVIRNGFVWDGTSCIGTETDWRELRADVAAGRASAAPRVVTTVEELDALPEGSVVNSSSGDVFLQGFATDFGSWEAVGDDRSWDTRNIALPALVLFTPDEGNTP
jgi:hypothetical protein